MVYYDGKVKSYFSLITPSNNVLCLLPNKHTALKQRHCKVCNIETLNFIILFWPCVPKGTVEYHWIQCRSQRGAYFFSVKKAKEFMMFDKEPNSPKETQKRSDPSMFNEESVDIDGQVQANNPVDLPNEDESYNEAESAINESEEAVSQEESDSKEELVADETDVDSEEITDVAESNEMPTDLDETSDEDEMNYDAYLKELEGKWNYKTAWDFNLTSL